MREKNLIREGGDELVAAGGEFGGDARGRGGEGGQDQKSTGSQGFFPVRGHNLRQRAGGTNDNGLRAAQENMETLFFNRRVEAADDAAPGIPPLGGLVVGGEDYAAGAFGGTE